MSRKLANLRRLLSLSAAGWIVGVLPHVVVGAIASGNIDELPRDSLPEYRLIPAAPVEELTPADGRTPVTTYEVGGRQSVVIACNGGGQLKSPDSDAWVAFALPKSI